MRQKDGKPGSKQDKNLGVLPMTVMFLALCGFSFYLGGIFCSEKNDIEAADGVKAVQSYEESVAAPLQIKPVTFNECSSSFQDYTPCTDPRRWKKYGRHRLTLFERHCPPPSERKVCLVPPPDGYKPPIRWPKSRDQCWYRNVPYEWINKQKSNQHWLKKEGDKFLFPGGGTMFPNGVGAYVDLMQDLIPEMQDGTVRTAIDTGCGMEILRQESSQHYSLELHSLARKPQSYACFSQCYVNGVKFVVWSRDRNKRTQNSGVMVEDGDLTYYGIIQNIIELRYANGMPVVLFDCTWFNTDPKERGSTKMDYGLLSVDTESTWYEDWPYCLATTARQVFYLDDLKAGDNWKVVNVVSHRGTYSDTSIALEDEDERDTILIPEEGDNPYQEQMATNITRDVEPYDNSIDIPHMVNIPRARRQLYLDDEGDDMFASGEDDDQSVGDEDTNDGMESDEEQANDPMQESTDDEN